MCFTQNWLHPHGEMQPIAFYVQKVSEAPLFYHNFLYEPALTDDVDAWD